MVCFNLAWINIAWDYNNSPFYRSLSLEMDRVHTSTGSTISLSPLILGKRDNVETIKFYFSSYSDGKTFSLWVGTMLHSQQVWKTPKIPVSLGNRANKNLKCHRFICSGELTQLSLRDKGKKRISPGKDGEIVEWKRGHKNFQFH